MKFNGKRQADDLRELLAGGFTPIELLVVIAMIAILAGVMLPALAKGKVNSQRIACLNNCKQFAFGSAMFSQDDENKAFTGTINYADDDQNWLFPNYVSDINSFRCPSTMEVPTNDVITVFPGVKSPSDLESGGEGLHLSGVQSSTVNSSGVTLYTDRNHGITKMTKSLDENAHGRNATYGSSYEATGYLNEFTRKTEAALNAYVYVASQGNNINLIGQVARISDIWVTFDEDDAIAGNMNALYDDFPEAGDNHGADGGNVAFADGHGAWVKGGRDYTISHAKGTDEYQAKLPIPQN
jgi:type II secretory pathway pseudopilin PulG